MRTSIHHDLVLLAADAQELQVVLRAERRSGGALQRRAGVGRCVAAGRTCGSRSRTSDRASVASCGMSSAYTDVTDGCGAGGARLSATRRKT